MASELKLRGGTTAQHAAFTGADREVTVNTTEARLVLHDGVTPGGIPLARKDDFPVPTALPRIAVEDFPGADPIGVGDSTSAFRAAAAAAGTDYCYVGPGTWKLTDSVSYPCHFVLSPGTIIPNQHWITSSLTDIVDRDFEALMGMGYFNIWLDGNTFSSPASGTHVATLWRVLYDGTAGTFVVDQAGGPFSVGASNGLRWNQTVAGTGGTYRILEFRLEDASIYNDGKATFSYFITGATAFNVKAEVVQFFGTGGSPSADVVCGSETVAAGTIKRRVLTVDMPSTAAKTFGTAMDDCVKLRLYLPINAVFNAVFNQVKFERGAIRTPFSQIPLAFQHAYIDRYVQYHIVSIAFSAGAAGATAYAPISYKSEMRKLPTATWATVSGHAELNISGATPTATFLQKYGGTAYITAAASGQSYALGQVCKLDARL